MLRFHNVFCFTKKKQLEIVFLQGTQNNFFNQISFLFKSFLIFRFNYSRCTDADALLMSLFKKLSVAVLCNVCFQELALTEPTPGSWLSQQLPCEFK